MKDIIVLGLLWLAYGFIHSLLATDMVKNLLKRLLGGFFRFYRLIYNVIAFLTLLPILFFQLSLRSEVILPGSIMNYVLGGLMTLSGITLIVASFKNYNLAEFLGTDVFDPASTPQVLKQDELSAVVRHPLYLGILLIIWGYFGIDGTMAGITTACVLTLYIRIGIYFEERKLVSQFGKAYLKYQQDVPMLIPKIF